MQQFCAYLRLRDLCLGTPDGLGGVRPVGQAQGQASRWRQFDSFHGFKAEQRHSQEVIGRRSGIDDRLCSWCERAAQ